QRGEKDQCAEPEALCDPDGNTQKIEEPKPWPHRPEVADVLVADGPRADAWIPQMRTVDEKATRVDGERLFTVCCNASRIRHQERYVGEQCQTGELEGGRDSPAYAFPARHGQAWYRRARMTPGPVTLYR